MHYSESEKPTMKPVEPGRIFAPPYETGLDLRDIVTSGWGHVCSCRFGKPRMSTVGEWSGDSYRYDIFRHNDEMALRCENGGGVIWLLANSLSGQETVALLTTISYPIDEAKRWDFCHALYEIAINTASAAKQSEALRWKQAIVDKRVKKRKVRGQNGYSVVIEEVCRLGDASGPVCTVAPKED